MTDAHHDTAEHDERRGRKAVLLGAEQRGDDDVAAGHQLAVRFENDAVAQTVKKQRLMRFRKPQFPRQAGMFDAGARRGTGTSVVTADQNHVRSALRHARCDRADADRGDELDVDFRARICVFQVENQFGQVLDRINIVMRRRRNQADAGRRTATFRDPRIHFFPRQLAAFARLGALCDFDLDFVGIHEIMNRDAEAAGRNLFDRASPFVFEPFGVFPAFTGIAFAADPVHGDGEAFMRFLADRSERHAAGFKTPTNRLDRFDFLDRHRIAYLPEFEQAAQRNMLPRLIVDQICEFLIKRVIVRTRRLLQRMNRLRMQQVHFPAGAPLMVATGIERNVAAVGNCISLTVAHQRFLGDRVEADAADTRGRPGKIFVDDGPMNADRFENLRAAVALERRNAHFRGDFVRLP